MFKLIELLTPSPSELWAVQVYTPVSALVTFCSTKLWLEMMTFFCTLCVNSRPLCRQVIL